VVAEPAVGGVAALKPWLDSLARACGCTSVRLDAGDEMQGTLLSNATFGRGTIDALTRSASMRRRSAITSRLVTRHAAGRMSEAKYPLSRRTSRTRRARRAGVATPWKLVTKNNVRIAVIA